MLDYSKFDSAINGMKVGPFASSPSGLKGESGAGISLP
jgi:hypothetical protein